MDTKQSDPLQVFTHDLNNLLVGIEGYGRLLSQESELSPDGRHFVSRLLNLVQDATDKSLAFQKQCGVRLEQSIMTADRRGAREVQDAFHLLVVDDEPAVREVVSKTLEEDGYEVTTAADGHEALEYFQAEHFDCVLLDLSMPIMSGNLVFARLKALDPNIPIVIMSALISDERMLTFSKNSETRFIQKPFKRTELLSLVQQVCSPSEKRPTRIIQNG
ncbi:MAG: response regulator [Bdellovibrionales bacterium]|nr:response regulator [Bdellovibrionales bacterium]